jgi:hypothetical protein
MKNTPIRGCKAFVLAALLSSPLSASAQAIGSIDSNFNSAPIAGGNYIWFNSHLTQITYSGEASTAPVVALRIKSIQARFTAGGTNYVVTLPNSTLYLTNGLSSPTGGFVNGEWRTSTAKTGSHFFVSGLMWKVPSGGLPGGINPVSMSMEFYTSNTGPITKINWQWGAGVYTQAPTDPNDLGAEVISASIPTNYKPYLLAGARGGGGSNYSGGWSATKSVSNLPLIPILPVGSLNLGKSVTLVGTTTPVDWTIQRDL